MKRITSLLGKSALLLGILFVGINMGVTPTYAASLSVTATATTVHVNEGTLITANYSDIGEMEPTDCTVTPASGTGHWYSYGQNVADSWQPNPSEWWYNAPAVGSGASSHEYIGQSSDWSYPGQPGWGIMSVVVYPTQTTTYTVTCTYVNPYQGSRRQQAGTPGTYSGSVTINVVPNDNLAAACSASPAPAFTGQSVTWNANVSGGNPPYNYSWSGDNGLSGSNLSEVISYLTTGTMNAAISITDSSPTLGQWEKVGSIPRSLTSGTLPACPFYSGPVELCNDPAYDSKQGAIDGATVSGGVPNYCGIDFGNGEFDEYECVQRQSGYIQPDTGSAECSDTINQAPEADLSAGTVSPTTVAVGNPTGFSTTVTNNGNANSGSFPVLFQIQNGDSFTSGYIGGIDPNGTGTGTGYYTFNSPGMYQVRACANRDSNNNPVVQDSNTNNDCGAWTSVHVYGAPAVSLSLNPSSITNGDSATLTWSCDSDSDSCAGSNFSTGGQLSGSVTVSPTSNTTYTVWAHSPGGTNSASQTITVGPKLYPDLVANPGNDASGYVGSGIGLSGTVYNVGTASTGHSFYNVMQVCAANGDCNSYDQLISTGLMGTLAVGASQDVGATANFSNAGTYSYRLCADMNTDWSTSVDEGPNGEGNNCSSWRVITVNPAPAADLTAGTVSPASATQGTPVTFSATAYNQGNADSGSFPILFQIQNGDQFNSGYISVAAGGANDGSATYTFASAGTYQIRACVNLNTSGAFITPESNYGNDCGNWSTVTVNAAARPDLIPGGVPNVQVTIGDPIPLTGTVTNSGDADAGAFDNIFLTNINADQTAWNTVIAGTRIDSLAQNASAPISVTLPASTFSAPGSYAYAYCVNLNTSWGNSVDEGSKNTNNCSAWGTITVLPKATLYPDLVPNPAPNVTVNVGDPISITASVTNQGQADVTTSFPTIFMTNQNTNGWDTLKSGSNGDPLAQGATENVTGSLPAFSSAGSYVYQYCVDLNTSWNGVVDEGPSGEGNNCQQGTITVQKSTVIPPTTNPPTNNPSTNNPPGNNPSNSCTNPANVGLTATPTRVSSGSSAKLNVTAEGMNQKCTLTGSDGRSINLGTDMCNEDNASVDTGAITTQTIFTLNCGAAGSKQAVVNVIPKFNEF